MGKNEFLDEVNADILADLIADPDTPDAMRVKMVNRLLESKRQDTFFVTMVEEKLSYGECPYCSHKNHWLIPESELAQIGWVSHKEDSRVKRTTDASDCPEWAQACGKKKLTI